MARREKTDGVDYDEDLDQIDFNNYKGMFYNDDPGQKYQDEVTGAHFEYHDMCRRLKRLQKEVQSEEMEDTGAAPANVETAPTKPAKESGQAFHTLHSMLVLAQPKESRNGAQALPQQGYGTVGAYYAGSNMKESVTKPAAAAELRNMRQFSSQLEQPQKPHLPAKLAHGSGRSKSIDKPHPFANAAGTTAAVAVSGSANKGAAPVNAATKPAKASAQKSTKGSNAVNSNAKRGTFYDLYLIFFEIPVHLLRF